MADVNLNKGNGEFFGPDDELPLDIKNKCVDDARNNLNNNNGFDLTLNLEKDDIDLRESEQEIALISFVGPYNTLKAKHSKLMFNIRGCCDTIDETRTRLTDIQEITKRFAPKGQGPSTSGPNRFSSGL